MYYTRLEWILCVCKLLHERIPELILWNFFSLFVFWKDESSSSDDDDDDDEDWGSDTVDSGSETSDDGEGGKSASLAMVFLKK